MYVRRNKIPRFVDKIVCVYISRDTVMAILPSAYNNNNNNNDKNKNNNNSSLFAWEEELTYPVILLSELEHWNCWKKQEKEKERSGSFEC